eukprot:15038517-Alexandrium_andersonii.AAC.1
MRLHTFARTSATLKDWRSWLSLRFVFGCCEPIAPGVALLVGSRSQETRGNKEISFPEVFGQVLRTCPFRLGETINVGAGHN